MVGPLIGRAATTAIVAYRRFLTSGLTGGLADDALRRESILGSAAFVAGHAVRARAAMGDRRVPARQRRADTLTRTR